MTTGIAPAVAAPTFDAMDAAPRAVFENFHLVRWRVLLQELRIIRDFGESVGFDMLQRVGKRHFAETVVVSIAFPVGGNVHELRPIALVRKTAQQSAGELFTAIEQSFEGDRAGNGAVIEEERDFAPGRQPKQVGAGWVNAISANVLPRPRAQSANPARLPWSEDREAYSEFRQQIKSFEIHCRLGKPHALGCAAEAVLEVPQTPDDLGPSVAAVRQRHDEVVIGLRQRRAVAGKRLHAIRVRLNHGGVDVRCVLLQPGKKRGSEIEADFAVVVDDLGDASFAVHDSRGCIGGVTLGRNSFIPVVVWMSGILQFNVLEKRILARWLVKMAVNADGSHSGVKL